MMKISSRHVKANQIRARGLPLTNAAIANRPVHLESVSKQHFMANLKIRSTREQRK